MSSEAITKNDLAAIFSEMGTLMMLDMFYPVGSYYETSDTTFNPNTAWGGTWVLEVAGMVHVSAGTGYAVNHANDNDGVGAKDGGASTVTLTENTIPSHTHVIKYENYSRGTGSNPAMGWIRYGEGAEAGTSEPYGKGQAHNNMQPYINVNRWHRKA